MFPVIGKYIEYKLDFVIVASESVIMYSQMGIFQRDVITIPAQNIKTILVKKESFLYSVFNNGDIVIMTEWGDISTGEVSLRRVPKPEKRRNEIAKIIGIDNTANVT